MRELNLTLKRLEGGEGESIWPPCVFSKNVSFKERAKLCFFVTFNIIISYIFPKDFIEIIWSLNTCEDFLWKY